MKTLLQKIASLLVLTLALTVLLSIGMGHWMSEEPMHHGNHECCDFVPMQTTTAPSTLLLLLPTLVAVFLLVVLYRPILIQKQLRFTPYLIQPHSRRLLRGVIQRE